MSDSAPEIRHRMTEQDWTEWGRLAVADWTASRRGSAWLWYAFDWVTFTFALLAWAYLSATVASLVLAPESWNAVFLASFLAVAGLSGWRDGRIGEFGWAAADFRRSLPGKHDCIVRLEESGIDAQIGGVGVHVSWAGILAVRHGSTIALITYDARGSGVLVPRRAFADQPAMDAFLAEIEARRSKDGPATG